MNNICKLSWNNMIEELKIIFLNLYLPKILDESLSAYMRFVYLIMCTICTKIPLLTFLPK